MRIRVCNKDGRTLKVLTVSNHFEIMAVDNRFDFWEYM